MKILSALLFAGALLGQTSFPSIAPGGLTYLSPNALNANAFSYQMADYDPANNQVLFYPYGSISAVAPANSGVLLVYKPVTGGFGNPNNWVEVDLTSPAVSNYQYAWNFSGGFTDGSGPSTSIAATNPTFAYLPPGPRSDIPGGASRDAQGDVTVQVNLANLASDPQNVLGQTYSFIDLSRVPSIPAIGGFGGVWANGAAYYCPTGDNRTGNANTILIRYNSALGGFNDPTAWENYDLSTIPIGQNFSSTPDPQLGGMQSAAYIAPFLYLIPFVNGNEVTFNPALTTASKLVVYDTTKSFTSAQSYQTFDLSTLSTMSPSAFAGNVSSRFRGYTGGVVVNGGTKLILVPWGDRNLQLSNSVALEYDSTKTLTDPTAWVYIDLTTVNQNAAGYQFGWLDNNGFVWFVPTHNFQSTSAPSIPPFIVYNTALPFNQTSSWTTYTNNGYPNGRAVWLTGAAYNPATNTAWMSAYGLPPASSATEGAANLELQEASATVPTVSPSGVVSAATYTSTVAPGSIAAAFGNFLVTSAIDNTSLPVSTSLSDVSIPFGGVLSPLFFVSPNQTNFQVPWELAGQSQSSLAAGLNSVDSPTQAVTLAPFAPGIFTADSSGVGQGEIYNTSNQLADTTNPPSPGDFVIIYCTGLGTVTNQPATGAPAPSSPLAATNVLPTVMIGGTAAQVEFSGLVPGLVGLYQVNAQIPAGITTGIAVPVMMSIGGVDSNTVTIAVQ